jgi:small GTP-binding protein
MISDSETISYLYKIVLVGEVGVGKTSLLARYIKGVYLPKPESTIGVEFSTRTVQLSSGVTVKAQLWDTAGQERYRAITSAHYRRAVGALLVYDMTNYSTFTAAKQWVSNLRENAEPEIVIMLVGNKQDVALNNELLRKVSYEEGKEFALNNGMLFSEASAASSYKVKEAFEELLEAINKIRGSIKCEPSVGSQKLNESIDREEQMKKRSTCCF